MRSLTRKQYKDRLEQFASTFKSKWWSIGSHNYNVSLHYEFKKALNEDEIRMPMWMYDYTNGVQNQLIFVIY